MIMKKRNWHNWNIYWGVMTRERFSLVFCENEGLSVQSGVCFFIIEENHNQKYFIVCLINDKKIIINENNIFM